MNKRKAIVTGASEGLGFCFCKELLARGYSVMALDLKISDELKAIECKDLQIVKCDVASGDSVRKARESFAAEKLDLIINNAGIWLDKERKKLSDPDFDFDSMLAQYQVNAVGVVRVVREFMPLLLKGDMKRVMNISSEAGSIGECCRICEYGYCMSKAAQNMATKLMSNDYSEKGVKFYAIHPGWMMTAQGFAGGIGDCQPKQRPEDSARILVDLVEGEPRDGMYYDINGRELSW